MIPCDGARAGVPDAVVDRAAIAELLEVADSAVEPMLAARAAEASDLADVLAARR